MTTCWEKTENATKYPQGFKSKLTVGDIKKRMTKAIKNKTHVHEVYVEMNEFSCIIVYIMKQRCNYHQ